MAKDNLPADVLTKAGELFVSGKSVSEVAAILKIRDVKTLYDLLRNDDALMRERNVHYEIDIDLLKYTVLAKNVQLLESDNENVQLKALSLLMQHMMPKRDKAETMTVINFSMDPPRMPDSPTYVYSDGNVVSNE